MDYLPETAQEWLGLLLDASRDFGLMEEIRAVLPQIKDQELLYQLGLRLSDTEILSVILPILEEERLVQLLADRHNPEVRLEISRYLSKIETRWSLFQSEEDVQVKLALIQPVLELGTDLMPVNLTEVIREETSASVRAQLIQYLDPSESELLTSIAFGDEFVEPRKAAVKLITDQEVLRELIDKEQNSEVRAAITRNLHDEKLLSELALSDLYWKVRMEALRLLSNEEVFTKAAENDPSMEIRLFAIERIKDPDAIAYIAMNENNQDLRRKAVELVINMGDEDTLLVIAQEESNLDIRLLAISHIDNRKILEGIIREIDDSRVFEQVASRITNTSLLAELLEGTGNLKLKRILVRRLIELRAEDLLRNLQTSQTGSVLKMIQEYFLR